MDKLLEVEHLSVSYETYAGTVQSVRDITFSIENNKTVALVGESGCGKSVTSKALLGLIDKPGKIHDESTIYFEGQEVTQLDEKAWRKIRGNQIAMIFQDALGLKTELYSANAKTKGIKTKERYPEYLALDLILDQILEILSPQRMEQEEEIIVENKSVTYKQLKRWGAFRNDEKFKPIFTNIQC